jgi:hypothetical protein
MGAEIQYHTDSRIFCRSSVCVALAASTSVVAGLFGVLSSENAPRCSVWTHMLLEQLKIGCGAAAAQHEVSLGKL